MSLPKAVVFDLGKVLVDFDYGIAIRNIAARSRVTVQELAHFITHSTLLFDYETGLVSTHDFFQRVRQVTGFDGDLNEFARLFADIFTPIEAMVRVQAQLRARGVPTYIFSNTNELAVVHIRTHYPFFSDFDDYIFSYEHRAMKPHASLYEVLELRSGLTGPELFYLDDRPENVAAGAARGWQAHLHESVEKSRAALTSCRLLD